MKKQKKKIEFIEEKHIYLVDGKIVPSVSEVMRPLTEGLYSKIPESVLNKAKIKGSGVHQAIEDYILFGLISKKYEGYVRRFIEFLEEKEFKVFKNEHRLTDGEYAGTIDLLLKDKDGGYCLVDIKTTSKIHDNFLGVQLSAYKKLLLYNGYDSIRCCVLQLKEDKYVFKDIEPNEEKWKELLNEYKNKVY